MKVLLILLRRYRKVLLSGYLAAWGFAFVATHLPGESLPELPTSDKLLHTVGFFALSLGFGIVLTGFGLSAGRRARAVIFALLLYGAFDEATQPSFGRTADVRDYGCDFVGVAAGVVVWELVLRGSVREERSLGG